MANRKDFRGSIEKMREVAELLSGWADDMERSLEKKSGRIAAEAILNSCGQLPIEVGAEDAVRHFNNALKHAYGEKLGKAEADPQLQMFANVILYSSYAKEIWSFGDCHGMINGRRFSFEKEIDKHLASIRQAYLAGLIAQGRTEKELIASDPSVLYMKPHLLRELQFANQKGRWGFDVLNGMQINPEGVVRISVSIGDEIVLASDGYPKLMPTLAESENELRRIMENDPLMFRLYPSVKGCSPDAASFDDRAYQRYSESS